MRFSVATATKAGDDRALQVGQWADDAPTMEGVEVAHGTFSMMLVGCMVNLRIAVCRFGFIHR